MNTLAPCSGSVNVPLSNWMWAGTGMMLQIEPVAALLLEAACAINSIDAAAKQHISLVRLNVFIVSNNYWCCRNYICKDTINNPETPKSDYYRIKTFAMVRLSAVTMKTPCEQSTTALSFAIKRPSLS